MQLKKIMQLKFAKQACSESLVSSSKRLAGENAVKTHENSITVSPFEQLAGGMPDHPRTQIVVKYIISA